MANYSGTYPADNEFIKNLPAAIREKGRQLKEDRIVDAGSLVGKVPADFADKDGCSQLTFQIGKGNSSDVALQVILAMVAGNAVLGRIMRDSDGKFKFFANGDSLADLVAASVNGKLINHDTHEQETDAGTTQQNFTLDKGNAAGVERTIQLLFERGTSTAGDAALMWDAVAGGFKLFALTGGVPVLANIDVLSVNGHTIGHDSHAQNTDTETDSLSFLIGKGTDPASSSMGFFLGGSTGPYLRWYSGSQEWQLWSAWNDGSSPVLGTLNLNRLRINNSPLRIPLVIEDQYCEASSTNYVTVKQFRFYRGDGNGIVRPRKLGFVYSLWGASAIHNNYIRIRYGGLLFTDQIKTSSEVFRNQSLDISGLAMGMHTLDVSIACDSGGTAKHKYFEASFEY